MNGALLLFLLVSVYKSVNSECFNQGTPLNSTHCLCPPYVDGNLCQNVKCQRFGIPDKNRCACAPGWYSTTCGLRGCRPENSKSSGKSLIIVANVKSSLKAELEALANFAENSSFDNYIIYGFVKSKGSTYNSTQLFKDSKDAANFLRGIDRYDGDPQQPVVASMLKAQQTFPQMYGSSQVVVLADGADTDNNQPSFALQEGSSEQLAFQATILWRNKMTIILACNPGGKEFDVYRRLALSTHSDLVFTNQNSTRFAEILSQLETLFTLETFSIGYGAQGNRAIQPNTYDENHHLYCLITVEDVTQGIPSVVVHENNEGKTYNCDSSFCLIKIAVSKSTKQITINASKKMSYNYRVLESRQIGYPMIEFNDDMHIDVGNAFIVKGFNMFATLKMPDDGEMTSVSYRLVSSSTGEMIHDEFFGKNRDNYEKCTFEIGFEGWKDSGRCPPGPLTAIVRYYYNQAYVDRTVPTYCNEVHVKKFNDPPPPPSHLNNSQCDVFDYSAVNHPLLNPARQFIFISSGSTEFMRDFISSLETSQSYNYEFTFISMNGPRLVSSHYNRSTFLHAIQQVPADYHERSSIYAALKLAQQLVIMPRARIFYINDISGSDIGDDTDVEWDIIDRTVEVNILAKDETATEFQWQSGGRQLPLSMNHDDIQVLSNMSQLTADFHSNNCSAQNASFDLYSNRANIIVDGVTDYQLFDNNGNKLSSKTLSSRANSANILVDVASNVTSITLSTNSPTGCSIAVYQAETANNVLVGFVGNISSDIASIQLPTIRQSSRHPIYVVARVKESTNKVVLNIDGNSYVMKPRAGCAFNFITAKAVNIPNVDKLTISVSAYSGDGLLIQRVFRYKTSTMVQRKSCLNGLKLNEFGICSCAPNHSGELCQLRVCANGGTSSFGICSCHPGFHGDFCEIGTKSSPSLSTSLTILFSLLLMLF